MTKDGLDKAALKRALENANSQQRLALMGRYARWIKQGARAQGWRGITGGACFGVGALGAIAIFERGVVAWLPYLGCLIIGLVGVVLFAAASRREREWREQNPFNIDG